MKLTKRIFCIMTALLLVCSAALPAFAGRENNTSRTNGLIGDVNQNGGIDAADALLILRYALGIIDLEPELAALSDADGNGTVDTADALLVLRTALLPPAEAPGFFMELEKGVAAYVDIDGDGADDTVLVEVLGENEEMEWEYYSRITITLACEPEAPFVRELPYCWLMSCAVADCDPDDGRREVIISHSSDEREGTAAIRVKKDGSGFEVLETSFVFGTERSAYEGFPADFCFRPSEGLPMMIRTEIMGTYYLNGRFTVAEEGFSILSEEFTYPERYTWPLTLKRPLDVILSDGSVYTVPTGTVVIPVSTDLVSSASLELEDGRIGTVEVSFNSWGHPYINGIDQDDLFSDIPYAD